MRLNIVYFSKNRPMQLDIALKTNLACMKNVNVDVKWNVLYKVDNENYKKAYHQVSKENSYVDFIEEYDFQKDLLMLCAWGDYTMFVVDDTIFVNPFNFTKIDSILKNDDNAIGFSLRLGKNTTHCYPYNAENEIPTFNRSVYKNIYNVDWQNVGFGDFAYPLELSSSVYRTSVIAHDLYSTFYSNPNELESEMDSRKYIAHKKEHRLYFFEQSVAFSNPLNKVQTVNNNRFSKRELYRPDIMLKMYNAGYRIKDTFRGFVPNGCHQEVKPSFYYKEEVNETLF